jgi:hypothetical protein
MALEKVGSLCIHNHPCLVSFLIAPAALTVIQGSAGFSALMLAGAIIPFVKIILFATQRKYLVD